MSPGLGPMKLICDAKTLMRFFQTEKKQVRMCSQLRARVSDHH